MVNPLLRRHRHEYKKRFDGATKQIRKSTSFVHKVCTAIDEGHAATARHHDQNV